MRLPSPPRVVLQLGFDDALLRGDVPAAPRDSRDFATLMRAAAALSSIRGLAQFDAAIAGLILDAVPGCRVALSVALGGETSSVRSAWERFPLVRHFKGYIISYRVKSRKPEPEIYQALIRRAGRPPNSILFIDDKMPFVTAAPQLGLTAWHFTSHREFIRDLKLKGLY